MTNLECVMNILASHREARKWDDHAVAVDLVAQLGLKPDDVAENAIVPVNPALVTEAEVVDRETAAKEATEKAKWARAALDAQDAAAAKLKADHPAVVVDQVHAAPLTDELLHDLHGVREPVAVAHPLPDPTHG